MTTIEKCKLAIEKGYRYDENTGDVFGVRGGVIKRVNNFGYLAINLMYKNKCYNLIGHQFAWYFKYNELPPTIDHINRDKLDNRIINLRSVTQQENCFNRGGVKGYSLYKKTNQYVAYITAHGKRIHLGLFNTEEEAKNVHLNAKKIYHTI